MKNFLLLSMVAAGAVMPAMAEKQADEPVDSIKVVELQDVQVVSLRANKKTPVAYTNVNKEQIKALNHGKDLPALLSMTPSVTMTSDAGNGIGYTTMMVRGSDNTRVNITANGIPLNDAESSGLYWVNMGDFASSAEDIQVQRGVGTSTNGAGAFGATVNIQTEKIGLKPFVGIDMSAGSYYSHKETLRFGTGLLGGHWGIQGRLSNIGSKGYLDRASSKLNSYFVQGGYFSDNTVVKFITFNGEEETYHAWNYTSKYEQSLYGRTYNSCGEYYDENDNVHYYKDQKDFYHQQHYQLLWDQHLPLNMKLNVGLHYTRGDGYYEQYKDNKNMYEYGLALSGKNSLINQKKMGNDFFGGVASLTYDNKEGLQAVLGGAWNRYIGDHFGYITWVKDPSKINREYQPFMEYYRNRSRKNDGNIYGKINYEFLKGLSAFADLQYRHVSIVMNGPTDEFSVIEANGQKALQQTIFGECHQYNFFNPKLGLNYQMTPNHRIYASVGIGHKEPTRNDFEANLGKSLKAEKLTDWEVGYKFQSETFSAGVNFYYMNYTDQFVLTGQLNNIGEPIKTNSGKSYRMGVELEGAWQPVEWFRWDANATFSKDRNKNWTEQLVDAYTGSGYEHNADGNIATVNLGETPISFSPSVIFNNVFTFSYNGFKAAVQSRFVGERYLTNNGFKEYIYLDKDGKEKTVSTMLDNFFTTNLDLSYTTKVLKKYGIKETTLGVTLYNIFSAKYDNNGWASVAVAHDSNGSLIAVPSYKGYHYYKDPYEAGFAPSAPFNFMVNLSVNF